MTNELLVIAEQVVEHGMCKREHAPDLWGISFVTLLSFLPRLTNGAIQDETGIDPWTIRHWMRRLRSARIVRGNKRPGSWMRDDWEGNLALVLDGMVTVGSIAARWDEEHGVRYAQPDVWPCAEGYPSPKWTGRWSHWRIEDFPPPDSETDPNTNP